jgi:hypothetical protein
MMNEQYYIDYEGGNQEGGFFLNWMLRKFSSKQRQYQLKCQPSQVASG